MTWTKLSDDFDQHPKIVAAGPLAELLHIHGLIYCNRYLTDGHIPMSVVSRLISVPEKRLVQRLVELGIWVKVEDGFDVHDFAKYQSTRAKVLANRKQKASAGQAGGLAKAKHESKHLDPVPVPGPVLLDSLETKHVGRTVPRGTTNGLTPLQVNLEKYRPRVTH